MEPETKQISEERKEKKTSNKTERHTQACVHTQKTQNNKKRKK